LQGGKDINVLNINSGYHKTKEIVAYRDSYPEKGVHMALTDDNSMVMPVQPMYGGYGGNYGGGGIFGNDGLWLLLVLLLGGGWGGFGGFGMGGMMGAGMLGMDMGFGLYPWLNNSQNINDGFRDQQLAAQVNGVQNAVTSGFGDVALGIAGVNQNICQTGNGITNAINQGFANTNLGMCQGFNGVNNAIFGAQTAISNQLNSNELANLERSFAAQTANTAGLTNLSAQLANCCCENRQATSDVKYTLASEGCATRTADAQNTNALLTAFNNGIQSIKDQLCSDKIESKNDIIAQLRSELMFARGQASQDVQTAAIQLGQRNLANEVEQYVAPKAIPAYVVQNPNCCGTVSSCGCNNF